MERCCTLGSRCQYSPYIQKTAHEHLSTNGAEKMRNRLAEDMLNEDFLYLMEEHLATLSDGGYLNSSIQLLKQTIKIISAF
jgi:hypothetical protein